MPSPFDITVATNTVSLDNKREGVATFTVHNTLRRRLRAGAKVTTEPPGATAWTSILPPAGAGTDTATVRDYPIDSTQQYQVKIAAPADATPGSYTLRLTISEETNPDDNYTVSPEVVFTVREQPKPEARPFPSWIIPAVIAAVVLIAVIVIGAVALSNREPPPTATPISTPTVVLGPCTIMMTAAQFTYNQPDTIANTMFDQIQAGAQFQPIGKSADNAWWQIVEFNINVWLQTSLLSTTATVTGNCVDLPVVCLLMINGDVDTYSKPTLDNVYVRAHAGWQFVPTGKLADNSWWQTNYQSAWIPTSVIGQKATSSGDCTALPVVSAPS